MKKKLIFYAAALTLFVFTGCRNENALPDCVGHKIQEIMQEPPRNPPAEIWQYKFEGKKVYYIPPYCCDAYSELLDENCRVICAPDGGITGRGDGRCPDFYSKRKNGILIWQDKR
jgi:hypothetical protein